MRTSTLAGLWRCLVILALGSTGAIAADLRVVAPSAPGSGWDQLAQAVKTALAAEPNPTRIEVVNVPGGNGTVGLGQFLAEPVDNRLLVTGLTMLDATLVRQFPVTLDRMTPVARLCAEYFVLVVPADSPLRSVGDLVEAFRTDPAKITWAGGPAGGIDHIGAALFARAVAVSPHVLNYVPFLTTADAVAATTDGKVTAAFLPSVELEPAIKAESLRVLAIGAPQRIARIMAATLIESGVDLEYANWRGLVAQPGLPPSERAVLDALALAIVGSSAWTEVVESKGWQSAYLPPEAFAAFIKAEEARVKGALAAMGLLRPNAE